MKPSVCSVRLLKLLTGWTKHLTRNPLKYFFAHPLRPFFFFFFYLFTLLVDLLDLGCSPLVWHFGAFTACGLAFFYLKWVMMFLWARALSIRANALQVGKGSSCQWVPCGCSRNVLHMKMRSRLFSLLVCLFVYLILSLSLSLSVNSLFLSPSHTPTEWKNNNMHTNMHTATHTQSSLTFPLRVSNPQVFYYSDTKHYESFSMHEKRHIYSWKLDIWIWLRASMQIYVSYVGKRRYVYMRARTSSSCIVSGKDKRFLHSPMSDLLLSGEDVWTSQMFFR